MHGPSRRRARPACRPRRLRARNPSLSPPHRPVDGPGYATQGRRTAMQVRAAPAIVPVCASQRTARVSARCPTGNRGRASPRAGCRTGHCGECRPGRRGRSTHQTQRRAAEHPLEAGAPVRAAPSDGKDRETAGRRRRKQAGPSWDRARLTGQPEIPPDIRSLSLSRAHPRLTRDISTSATSARRRARRTRGDGRPP